MGFLHDLLLETKCEQFEKDLKEAYGMGFRDGRLCPQELRPCEVDGKACLFHCWAHYDEERLQFDVLAKAEHLEKVARNYRETGVMDATGRIEKVRQIAALVEYPDGSVGKVKPELITFLDRREG